MLMEMEGVEKCTKLRYNKERAAREAKEQHKLEEEEEKEEREKKRKEKVPKAKKGRSSEYQQPLMLEELKPGQWRCMEDDMEVVPGASEEQVMPMRTPYGAYEYVLSFVLPLTRLSSRRPVRQEKSFSLTRWLM